MQPRTLALLIVFALWLPACEDGISIGDDDTGDDDAGDDDTTAAPPDSLAFTELLGGYGGQAFVLGGELYVVYGGKFLRWESGTEWEVMADTSPGGLNCNASFNVEVLGGKAYVLGGHYQQDENCTSDESGATDQVWVFDPSTNQASLGPSMLHRREVLASGVAGGAIYVIGGWNPVGNLDGENNDVVEWFDGSTWSTLSYSGDYTPVRSAAYATVGDQIYLFAGCEPGKETDLDCPCNSQLVQAFDTTTATFSRLPDMPLYGRHFLGQHAAARGQYVYVFGGATGFSCVIFDDVARFDSGDGSWEMLPEPMTTERKGVGSAIYDDQLFVFGGISCPEEGCDDDACDHPGTIPNCSFIGAGANEIGTFVGD